jgi:hypothetical protein
VHAVELCSRSEGPTTGQVCHARPGVAGPVVGAPVLRPQWPRAVILDFGIIMQGLTIRSNTHRVVAPPAYQNHVFQGAYCGPKPRFWGCPAQNPGFWAAYHALRIGVSSIPMGCYSVPVAAELPIRGLHQAVPMKTPSGGLMASDLFHSRLNAHTPERDADLSQNSVDVAYCFPTAAG